MYVSHYTYLMQYDLRMSHLEEDMEYFLESRIHDRNHSNVIVMCEVPCMKELFHQVCNGYVNVKVRIKW